MHSVLVPGPVNVTYGQIYVEPDDGDYIEMEAAFAGQTNGLCGAAQPQRLFLMTATHTGKVNFTVELHTEPPALNPEWDEIVEASITIGSEPIYLFEWAHENAYELPIPPGVYRVRYNVKGMEFDADPGRPEEQYCLQFWPAPEMPDQILKVTSPCATYWHDTARAIK